MKQVNISEGHQQIMPHLIVGGAVDFMEFLKNAFHGEEVQFNLPHPVSHLLIQAKVRSGTFTAMQADATEQLVPKKNHKF